ncbi:response regulator [Pseudomonadota bacterium]
MYDTEVRMLVGYKVMPSILIIDDRPENLSLLTEILMEAGYGVRQVRSGQLALKTATASPPDLILLDIMMPGMDGYEVCRRLKEHDELKAIPVIFITSLDDTTDKVRAFAAGGVDYVVKPIDPEEVLARVRTHLDIKLHQNGLEDQIQKLHMDQPSETSLHAPAKGSGIKLTEREKECLLWLARGLRNDRISEKLGIKPVTVQLHIDKAKKKLHAATREQALSIAIQIGAVQL